jgi:hypothetical protein
MVTPTIAIILVAALIPAVFFVFIGLRAYLYRDITENEANIKEVREAARDKKPIDVGAQKR